MPLTLQQAGGLGLVLLGLGLLVSATLAPWGEGDVASEAVVEGPEVRMEAPEPDLTPRNDDRPRAFLKGRVVDGSGHPVVGAVAKLDTELGSFAAQTIRGGRFTIEGPVGTHLVYATRLVGDDELVGPPLLIDLRDAGVAGFDLTLPADGTVGIGVVLDLKGNDLVVTWAQEGRSAFDAGVRSGDRLLAIDGVSTERMGLRDAERALQGLMGSEVVLTVRGEGKPRGVVVRRRPASEDEQAEP